MVSGIEWYVEALLYATLAAGILVPITSPRKAGPALALAWLGVVFYAGASWLTFLHVATGGALELYQGLIIHDAFTPR